MGHSVVKRLRAEVGDRLREQRRVDAAAGSAHPLAGHACAGWAAAAGPYPAAPTPAAAPPHQEELRELPRGRHSGARPAAPPEREAG